MANSAEMLMNVLAHIEMNITGEIKVDEIAKNSYLSVSSLQKTFKYVFHMTVKDYILRRKFTCAAKDLITTDDSILDIALKYGYSNHESFTRGFHRVWGISPSEYRKSRHFTGHTPKLSVKNLSKTEESNMSGMKYDIAELYDVLRDRRDKAYVCADIKYLMWINEKLGRKAGDAVILETMRRIEAACNDDDIFLRIGGDEFVVFTNSEDKAHAEDIVAQVGNNHDRIHVDGKDIAVETHIGSFVGFPEKISAEVVFYEIAKKMSIIHYLDNETSEE